MNRRPFVLARPRKRFAITRFEAGYNNTLGGGESHAASIGR
jgi:hypothetical protein